jgi:hypothetical protein
MRKLLLLFGASVWLFASSILNYNVYNRSNRVDVMFTFDTPYTGTIKESKKNGAIVLQLYDLSIQRTTVKEINSKLISKLTITPLQSYTQIVAYTDRDITLQVSQTTDHYGLRLRFVPTSSALNTNNNILDKTAAANLALHTQKPISIPTSYYIIVALLIIIALVLFLYKRKIGAKSFQQNKSPQPMKSKWMFQQGAAKNENDVHVRFSKKIDPSASVMMIDYGEQSYLVMNGTSSVLLDVYHNDKPVSRSHFDELLQKHTMEIEQLMQLQNNQETEPFTAYKEKASSISYEER